jgi:hypothetical protein
MLQRSGLEMGAPQRLKQSVTAHRPSELGTGRAAFKAGGRSLIPNSDRGGAGMSKTKRPGVSTGPFRISE